MRPSHVRKLPVHGDAHVPRRLRPSYAPGTYWVYSNQAYALLGALLSYAFTGGDNSIWGSPYQAWPQLVINQVATPLGMATTQVDYSTVTSQVAQGYAYQAGATSYQTVDPPNWAMKSAGLAAGAMSSTLNDMLTFLEYHVDAMAQRVVVNSCSSPSLGGEEA